MSIISKRTPEIEAELLDRLSEGERLTDICREERLPSRMAISKWVRADPGFASRYHEARALGMQALADEILEIADDGRNDWMKSADPANPGYRANGEIVARSRLRVDTRKFLMAKIAPLLFGDRIAITGADGGAVKTEEVTDPRVMAQKVAFLLAAQMAAAEKTED